MPCGKLLSNFWHPYKGVWKYQWYLACMKLNSKFNSCQISVSALSVSLVLQEPESIILLSVQFSVSWIRLVRQVPWVWYWKRPFVCNGKGLQQGLNPGLLSWVFINKFYQLLQSYVGVENKPKEQVAWKEHQGMKMQLLLSWKCYFTK